MPTNVLSPKGASKRRRKCSQENCIHELPPAEILLNPEILLSLPRRKEFRGFSSGNNPLLEFCLDGGLHCYPRRKYPRKSSPIRCPQEDKPLYEEEDNEKGLMRRSLGGDMELRGEPFSTPTNITSSPLSRLLSNPGRVSPQELELLCQTESCDINVQNPRGETPLHSLILGCSQSSFPSVLKCLQILLDHGINVNTPDTQGNTALHTLRDLLAVKMSGEANMLARLLLEAGADVNALNTEGRTLLSYAASHADQDLVRLLLEHGALVWPLGACSADGRSSALERLILSRESSAFTWFVKTSSSSLFPNPLSPQHLKTLQLLCQSMSDEELDPQKLKRKVLSTLVHLGGNSSKHLGPLFTQLKRTISPFWTRPLPLKYLCKRKIRRANREKTLPLNLRLPKSLRDYLELDKTEF